MKEKQSKCFVKYISSSRRITWYDIWYLLYIGSKIYIEKIFSKKYPNNIFDWLQRENRNLHKLSWEKKSNLVDGKYLRLHRWIAHVDSHVELSILQVWTLVLQLGGDSATWRWFATLIRSLEVISRQKGDFAAWRWFRKGEAFSATFSQPISQLRNGGTALQNGTRVPRGGFAAAKPPAKWGLDCEISAQLCAVVFKRP